MRVKVFLKPRNSGVPPFELIYLPRKNLVADKYFAQLKDFIDRNIEVDENLSYWNFAYEPEQKEEYVRDLQKHLDIAKAFPTVEMNYTVSVHDSQDLLNEIHDKFEYYLKKIHASQLEHPNILALKNSLLQINLLIHKLENFNATIKQLSTRDKDFIDCAFGFRFNHDLFHDLEEHDYDHFTMERPFGSMACGYNTTGKNIIHAMNDNDLILVTEKKLSPQKTFSTEAFFWFGRDVAEKSEMERLYKWWDENNITTYCKFDRKNSIGLIPLADLVEPEEFKNKTHWEKIMFLNQYSGVEKVLIEEF